jgi:hypothetical protein
MQLTDKERGLIDRGLFVPVNVKKIAQAYYRERLSIHGESMKAYSEVSSKFGRSVTWVRRAIN